MKKKGIFQYTVDNKNFGGNASPLIQFKKVKFTKVIYKPLLDFDNPTVIMLSSDMVEGCYIGSFLVGSSRVDYGTNEYALSDHIFTIAKGARSELCIRTDTDQNFQFEIYIEFEYE